MDYQPVNVFAESSSQESELVTLLNEKMMLHSGNAPDPHAVCIYKVPEKLLKGNDDAYTPRILSIGPFHHGKPHLQAMERYKYRCLKRFLERGERSPIILHLLVKHAKDMESSVRECYNDTFDHLKLLDLSKIIMLDGIFIVELLLENFKEAKKKEHECEYGHERGLMYELRFMKNDILHDMLLLENQLPLFVLHELYYFVKEERVLGIDLLAREYFKIVGIRNSFESPNIRSFHLLAKLRNDNCHIAFLEPKCSGKLVRTRSATELQGAAGVKFIENPTDDSLVYIVFDSSKGTLHIPQVTVNEWTKAYFGNLIALEQCTRGMSKLITSYVILMDDLINTCEDVDLLVKSGIIVNSLGENQLVADLFNSLYKESDTDNRREFYYERLCNDLNEYSRDYWHQWKATMVNWKRSLRQDYFNNPWSSISVIAAVILLALTAIQTACSIIQM